MCVDFYVWAFSLRGFVTSAFRHSLPPLDKAAPEALQINT
jgi:hypothetical protein